MTSEFKQATQLMRELFKECKVFKDIMDGLNEVAYVADFNHNVLWCNKKAIELFGDYKGKKCYEHFQGLGYPCSFCTNEKLKELYQPYKWQYTNPKTNKTYTILDMMISWNGSGNVRFELAIENL